MDANNRRSLVVKNGTFARPEDITEDDLLTWELQLRKEGTLPPDVQRQLLEHVGDRKITAADVEKVREAEYAVGYEEGRGDRLGPG